jgi:hypothetical protein
MFVGPEVHEWDKWGVQHCFIVSHGVGIDTLFCIIGPWLKEACRLPNMINIKNATPSHTMQQCFQVVWLIIINHD